MEYPLGFTSSDSDHKVCKLQRSIYGLKQASQSWNTHFNDVIKIFDFIKNKEDSCVYKKVNESAVIFLVLYVDDILLIKNNIFMLISIKVWLSKEFVMKLCRRSFLHSWCCPAMQPKRGDELDF